MIVTENININDFASKFTTLKQERFSGRVIFKSLSGQEWNFYLFLGRILYATGGNHPVRRWRRNFSLYCPQTNLNQLKPLPNELNSSFEVLNCFAWEYQLLYWGLERQQITREQAARIIGAIVTEVLFDVTQAIKVTYEVKSENISLPQLVLLDPEQVVTQGNQLWQTWQKAKVTACFANHAPVIKQPEQLLNKTSLSVYQYLTILLDGQCTLRELSVKMKRDVVQVATSLLPYIQAALVELIEIPDLQAPVSVQPPAIASSKQTHQASLILCVDDSPAVCKGMEKLLTTAGYQFIGVQDSLRAITTILTHKPDIIFLDVVMPYTNGYEICSQLRKVSAFRHTPIIILTGNDGIVDRVRAKLAGASGFLSKPVYPQTLLTLILEHLNSSYLNEEKPAFKSV